MNSFKKLALCCALFLAPLSAIAQTAVSGSRVQDGTGTGTPLPSGTWCFAANCLTVTNGAFSGSVTAATQTVTVVNASSVTVLTVPGVVIGSGAFSWDGFVIPSGSAATGTGVPAMACAPGATFTQTNSSPANKVFTCSATPLGQAVWTSTGPTPAPTRVAAVVASETPVSSSATPSFLSITNASYMIMTANVTSWSVAAGFPGQTQIISFCENATGGFTLSGAPSNVLNWPGLTATTANSCTSVPVTYNSSVMAWVAPPAGSSSGGTPGGTNGQVQIKSGSSFAGITPNVIPQGGTILFRGDSLCSGELLPGHVAPGYPGGTIGAGAFPLTLQTALTNAGWSVNVVDHCTDGQTLGGLITAAATDLTTYAPNTTGLPALFIISIYGNDETAGNICPSSCTYTTASYIAAIQGLFTTATNLGYKVGFLAQWAQFGRQNNDGIRTAINDAMAQTPGLVFLDFRGFLNTPTNSTYYDNSAELHANLLSQSMMGPKFYFDMLTGGVGSEWGKYDYEDSLQQYVVNVNTGSTATGFNGARIQNNNTAGYAGWDFVDNNNTTRAQIGCGNSTAAAPWTATCVENFNIGYTGSVNWLFQLNGVNYMGAAVGHAINYTYPSGASSSLGLTVTVVSGGCVLATPTGGWAGSVSVTTGGTCVLAFVPQGTTNVTNGYTGQVNDITQHSAMSETTCTTPRQQACFTGTLTAADVLHYEVDASF